MRFNDHLVCTTIDIISEYCLATSLLLYNNELVDLKFYIGEGGDARFSNANTRTE